MRFSEYLRRILDRHQVRQGAAAKYVGVSDATMSRWLGDKSIPDPPQCRRIAEHFHIPEQEVLRAAGHLSTVMISEGRATQAERELDAWVRSLSPERQAALLELRPVIEAMAAKFVERDPREAWRVAELWLKYRSSADGQHQTVTSPD